MNHRLLFCCACPRPPKVVKETSVAFKREDDNPTNSSNSPPTTTTYPPEKKSSIVEGSIRASILEGVLRFGYAKRPVKSNDELSSQPTESSFKQTEPPSSDLNPVSSKRDASVTSARIFRQFINSRFGPRKSMEIAALPPTADHV